MKKNSVSELAGQRIRSGWKLTDRATLATGINTMEFTFCVACTRTRDILQIGIVELPDAGANRRQSKSFHSVNV